MKKTKRVALASTLAVFLAAGCDTTVTNPGPVQDEFLDSLNAHQAIVNGAGRNLSDALDQVAYWSGALTYELNPAGSTGSFGIPTSIQDGRWSINNSADWNRVSLARFTAENAIARFDRVLPEIQGAPSAASYAPRGEALLLAGYANRIFGETFCRVVYDGGAAQPFTDALTRAATNFTEAMTYAGVATAAEAGLASVEAALATYGMGPGWGSANTHAGNVVGAGGNTFLHQAGYSNQDQSQGNYIMIGAPGLGTYRAHTTWGTFYEDHFRTTGDTRTPWTTISEPFGDAGVTKFGGNVNFFPQDKYDEPEDGIDLSSGWEMLLIQAEYELAANNAADAAVALMNIRLNDLGLTLLTTGRTVAQVYTDLKAERSFELWLEGRRMFDLRRWEDNSVSGGIADVHDGVYGTSTAVVTGVGDETAVGVKDASLTTLATNARCYTIGDSEFDTNTNISR